MRRLESDRLITLVGPGGVGKTRLAVEIAVKAQQRYADGAWFVDFAAPDRGISVAQAVASRLRLGDVGDPADEDAVSRALSRRELLLVLDNCEHVVTQAATLCGLLLRRCMRVSLLATSLEALKIDGEVLVDVPPLELPTAPHLQDVKRCSAVELFERRCQAADARFAVGEANVAPVVRICRRVDGMPLGIELAASRVKSIGLDVLASRLDDEFAILKNFNRGIPARQQTMRSLIEWAYELLSPAERTLLHRLAIFSGGCSLSAVDFVCGFDSRVGPTVMETLSSLVEKSQVVAETGRPPIRYRLLQSIQEFALAKLRASGEYERLAGRHAQWFARFAQDAAAMAGVVPRAAWIESMFRDITNLNDALQWSLGHHARLDCACSVILGMQHYWYESGLSREGLRSIDATLAAAPELDGSLLAQVMLARATLSSGEVRLASLDRARSLFESLGDRLGLAKTASSLAIARHQMGDHEGSAAAGEESIAHFHAARSANTAFYVTALGFRALALIHLGRVDEGRALFAESEALLETRGDRERIAMGRVNHAEAEFALGHADKALELVEGALAMFGAPSGTDWFNDRFVVSANLNAAAYNLVLGNIRRAYRAARIALTLSQRMQFPVFAIIALQHIATVAAYEHSASAACLRGYVDAAFEAERLGREPTELQTYEILVTTLGGLLRGDQIDSFALQGSRFTFDQACTMALNLPEPQEARAQPSSAAPKS